MGPTLVAVVEASPFAFTQGNYIYTSAQTFTVFALAEGITVEMLNMFNYSCIHDRCLLQKLFYCSLFVHL